MHDVTLPALTWHFFERAGEPDLWCAVPAHASLPRFLLSDEWHFSGHRQSHDRHPAGFNPGLAVQFDGINGFYLFQRLPSQA